VRGFLRAFAPLAVLAALLVAGAPLGPVAAAPVRPSTVPTIAAADDPAPRPIAQPNASVAPATPEAEEVPAPSMAVATAPAPPARPAAPIASLYRITIPRLGISLYIQEGDIKRDIDDQRTPESYAFHLPGTAMPGEGGNTFLYAHARSGMFLSLWNARPGDDVFIAAPGGQLFAYVVREVLARVAPTDVSSTRPTSTERLTLQTSTGPNASDPRFVVVAFPRGS